MSWICFDQTDSEILSRNLGLESSQIQAASGDAVLSALERPGSSVVLLPGESAEDLILLQVKKPAIAAGGGRDIQDEPPQPKAYRSSGFLGLNDEPIYLDDAEAETTSPRWWRRMRKST